MGCEVASSLPQARPDTSDPSAHTPIELFGLDEIASKHRPHQLNDLDVLPDRHSRRPFFPIGKSLELATQLSSRRKGAECVEIHEKLRLLHHALQVGNVRDACSVTLRRNIFRYLQNSGFGLIRQVPPVLHRVEQIPRVLSHSHKPSVQFAIGGRDARVVRAM